MLYATTLMFASSSFAADIPVRAPKPDPVKEYVMIDNIKAVKDEYIVILEESAFETVLDLMDEIHHNQATIDGVEHTAQNRKQSNIKPNRLIKIYSPLLGKYFHVTLTKESVKFLKQHPMVKIISPNHHWDGYKIKTSTPIKTPANNNPQTEQVILPANLDRIDQEGLPLDKK